MFSDLPKDVGAASSSTYPAGTGAAGDNDGDDDGDNNRPPSHNFSSTGDRAIYDMSSAQSSSWADDDESYSRLIHIASDVTLLGGVLGTDNQTSALEEVVGNFLRQGTYAGITIYVTLIAIMVGVAPIDSYQYMNRTEQVANAVLFTILIGVNGNRLGPLFVNDRNWKFLKSGAMLASFTVQLIAIFSVAAMLFLPTPVIIDETTGMRCHLVRWAEWIALAFIMTFLTEAIDLPLEAGESNKSSWIIAGLLALSTGSGALFPFCPNTTSWIAVMIVAWALFMVLPIKMIHKGVLLRSMSRGETTAEKESYERCKFSVRLYVICTVLWTMLALSFTICCAIARFAGPDSPWADEALVLATENVFEALSKVGYLSILMEIHEQLFDDVAKKARRLQDLCNYMSAVWDVSSDVVIICSKSDHLINAAVSPAIFTFGESQGPMTSAKKSSDGLSTLVMEVDPYEGCFNTFEVDLSKPITPAQAERMLKESQKKEKKGTPVFEKNLKVLADLVGDACAYAIPEGRNQHVLTKSFYRVENFNMENTSMSMHCEAKIANLKGKAVLIILRDMSDRLRLAKAEMTIDKLNKKVASK